MVEVVVELDLGIVGKVIVDSLIFTSLFEFVSVFGLILKDDLMVKGRFFDVVEENRLVVVVLIVVCC